jgi:hypothetical protein
MGAFLAAQVPALLAGALLLTTLGGWRLHPGLFIPAAWLAGTGALAAEYLLLAQGDLPWTPVNVALPWLAVAVLAAWRLRAVRPLSRRPGPLSRRAILDALVALLILVWTAGLVDLAVSTPLRSWDSFTIWVFKGRVFHEAGTVPDSFFLDPHYDWQSHPDYPLLVPLQVARIYAWTGDNDTIVKAWWALLAGAAAAAIYFGLAGLARRVPRLIGVLMLLAVPEIVNNAAGHLSGYADLPLALFLLYGALFLYRGLATPDSSQLSVSALFFCLAAFTKNEGIITAAASLTLLLISSLLSRRLNRQVLLATLVLVLLIVIPWQLETRRLGLESDLQPTLGRVLALWQERLTPILAKLGAEAADIGRLNLLWFMVPVLAPAALGFERHRFMRTLPLLAIIGVHLAAAVVAYITTPHDLTWHLGTSADRVLFQPSLILLLLATLYIDFLLRRPQPA